MHKRIYESTESAHNVIKTALTAIADEWKIVAKNFTLIDEHEIEVAVDLINSDIEALKSEDKDAIVDVLVSDDDLDIFDDVYVKDNKIIADCFILNSKLTNEERQAVAYNKGNVTIKPLRETGRDLIEVVIDLTPSEKSEHFARKQKTRKLEKIVNSDKGTLYELASNIDSALTKNKIKGILDFYGDFLDCTIDLRSFGTKVKDIFKSFISDEGNLQVCSIFPVSEGKDWTFDKFKVLPQFGDKESKPKTKILDSDDAEQYVLELFDKANEYYSSQKNEE